MLCLFSLFHAHKKEGGRKKKTNKIFNFVDDTFNLFNGEKEGKKKLGRGTSTRKSFVVVVVFFFKTTNNIFLNFSSFSFFVLFSNVVSLALCRPVSTAPCSCAAPSHGRRLSAASQLRIRILHILVLRLLDMKPWLV